MLRCWPGMFQMKPELIPRVSNGAPSLRLRAVCNGVRPVRGVAPRMTSSALRGSSAGKATGAFRARVTSRQDTITAPVPSRVGRVGAVRADGEAAQQADHEQVGGEEKLKTEPVAQGIQVLHATEGRAPGAAGQVEHHHAHPPIDRP